MVAHLWGFVGYLREKFPHRFQLDTKCGISPDQCGKTICGHEVLLVVVFLWPNKKYTRRTLAFFDSCGILQ
jgi:hypothetical protein